MKVLWLTLRVAIVFVVAYVVYGLTYTFVWNGLGVSHAYLGWFAAASIAGPLAAMVGLGLAGLILREWKP